MEGYGDEGACGEGWGRVGIGWSPVEKEEGGITLGQEDSQALVQVSYLV